MPLAPKVIVTLLGLICSPIAAAQPAAWVEGKPAAAALPSSACAADTTAEFPWGPAKWGSWSPSVTNDRFQSEAAGGLTASSVPRLKLKWAFNLGPLTEARSQPVIAAGEVFVTTRRGMIYALDTQSGCTRWSYQADGPVRSGVSYGKSSGEPAIFFADTGKKNMYALSARTGQLIWKVATEVAPIALVTATPQYYEGKIYQPFASREETLALNPAYPCCQFRGSIVAFDANTGKRIWEGYTFPQAPAATRKNASGVQNYGPSGAGVWSSPTIDQRTGLLYVATGDNYSDPPTATSDAVLAFDMQTGQIRWSQQLTRGDAFNNSCSTPRKINCPQTFGKDADFGQPPILVDLGDGKRELVIAQKSGMAYALDPDNGGEVLWERRVGEGGPFGGSQWGSASDGHRMYVAISDLSAKAVANWFPVIRRLLGLKSFHFALNPSAGGGLSALDLRTGAILWTAAPQPCSPPRPDCSPAHSAAVTAIPGAVFSGSVDGHLRAYSADDGTVIWDFDTERSYSAKNGGMARGGSLDAAGPAVADGMVFVNSGYAQFGGAPGNVLLAFSVEGK